jgi:alpha-tubulin suppressor-like RCC1 family protein
MATTVNLGKLRFDWRGDYQSSLTYVSNDVVTHRQQQYICIQTTTVGIDPTNTAYWTVFTSMFNNRGAWASAQSYLVGDIVIQSTPGNLSSAPSSIAGQYSLSRATPQAFYCITAHTSTGTITPADASYWTPVNRKGISGAQTSTGATTSNYNLGVYSNQNYSVLVLPNRGIAFDNSPNYYGGTTGRNSTDANSIGAIMSNGQCISWGQDVNGSGGMAGNSAYGVNTLTFPFYDFWRSSSSGGVGVHSTPDGNLPRAIQWEKSHDRNLVLMNSGEVFAWGGNQSGMCGDGTTSNRSSPVRVGGSLTAVYGNVIPTTGAFGQFNAGHVFTSVRIKRIASSGGNGFGTQGGHCMAIDENGQLWTWGDNSRGQLGVGAINSNLNTTNQSWPQPIPKTAFNVGPITTGQNVVAIWACGGGSNSWSFAVTQDGNLWAWGDNQAGQLGLGNTNVTYVPTVVNNVANQGLNFGGATLGTIVKIQTIDSVYAARGACAILTSNKTVYVCGNNTTGWMGITPSASVNIWTNVGGGPGTTANASCKDMWLYGPGGFYGTMMQRDNATGICYTAGYNVHGQLGYGGTGTSNSSTFTVSKVNVGGVLYNLLSVKQLSFTGGDPNAGTGYVTASVITDNGLAFSIGYNAIGAASAGFQATFTANADSNTLEYINQYAWQPVRAPSQMVGKFQDTMGWGNAAGAGWLSWINSDGRFMIAGRGNPGSIASSGAAVSLGSAFGQYWTSWGDSHIDAMTAPVLS